MQNIGEELAGEYLRHFRGCDFITYNITTTEVQGEIDVFAMNSKKRHIYVCEVAVHLETGLQYTKNRRPDNVGRLGKKMDRAIHYLKSNFPKHKFTVMLWSPKVKVSGKKAKRCQMKEVVKIQRNVKKKHKIDLELVINERYLEYLNALKSFAKEMTPESKSPVIRLFQIEEKLKKHVDLLAKRKAAKK